LYTQEDLDKSREKLEKAKKRRDFVDKIEWDKYNVVSFYEWIIDNSNDSDEVADAKKAIEAINMYPDMIDLDNLKDSTNINNVKAALNYLKYINELRRNDENFKNLSDLKTNHVIMAMAISNAAHSIDGHLRHFLEVPGYYNRLYAENLAYTPNNPYNGWYYKEKDAYNYLMNKYDNFNPYGDLSEDQKKEIQDLFGIPSIGHYLNIVNQDATTVGMGMDTTPEKVGPYGAIYALNFSTESDAKKSISIEEYIKRYDDFLSYINDYESRKELEDAQSEYEKIKNEFTNPSIDQYKEKINEANKSIENAEEKLKQRQNLLVQAKSSIEESQKLYNQTLNLENELKEKLDKSKASIDENIKNDKSYLKLKDEIDNLNKEIDLKTK
ncbi:MAG: CAP domain-containing protein, partial [Anaerococcus sp.]|nr:CAP domain-containing protein [Anaerococcus sp.]